MTVTYEVTATSSANAISAVQTRLSGLNTTGLAFTAINRGGNLWQVEVNEPDAILGQKVMILLDAAKR